MLSVKVQTFKENKIVVIVFMLIALGFLLGIYPKNDGMNGKLYWICALVIVSIISILYLLFNVEISIYDNGISTKTFFVRKEMLWEDVTRFTYGTTKQSSSSRSFISTPVIIYYMRLENTQGQKIKIGYQADDVEKLAKLIIQYTLSPLCRKAVNQYNSGAEVDFGLIKLSQSRGLKSKGLFRSIEIPFNQVTDYYIEKGWFFLFRQGKKFAAISVPIKRVPNAFALVAMLDSMLGRNASAGQTPECLIEPLSR